MRYKMAKLKFYRLDNILSQNAHYNLIIGERSNGKSYACKEYAIKQYFENGAETAIIRRFREDLRGRRASDYFKDVCENGIVEKLSKGEYNTITYYAGRWYFAKGEMNEDGIIELTKSVKPFAYFFALTDMEHDKSTSEPNIKIIIFEEFLTRKMYLPDEFVIFMNTLSTIIRLRNDVKIFMLGNTVNQWSPYFSEMGLKHIREMKPKDIDLYTYGESDLRVAVEFADSPSKNKPSNVYFAFDNPKLNMIKGGSGAGIWEVNIYPHCPVKYQNKDIRFVFFIKFDADILQCEIVYTDSLKFIYIHRKTTELKNPEKDLIYCLNYDVRPNWRRKLNKPILDIEKKIYMFFAEDKIFYQDNEVGEIVRNYLKSCSDILK